MFEHKVTRLTPHITQIQDASGVFLFLVQGEREALLVDTGTGFAGLRETVDALTDLPLTVVLTHMHPDHAGGVSAFEKVYVHPADIPDWANQDLESRMGYARAMNPGVPMTEADFLPPVMDPGCFVPMEDGTVFDLGGYHVEIIHVPGHTPGSCCILFREERIILFGDACNINTLIMWGPSLSVYRESLLRLQTHRASFDRVYYSHGGTAEGPASSLEDNIALCTEILEGRDDAIPCDFLGMPALRAKAIAPNYYRLDGGYGNIVYTEITKK